MRRVLSCAALLVVVFLAGFSQVSASTTGDYDLVLKEFAKPASERNYTFIDEKLASIVAHPEDLNAGLYPQARRWQIQREMEKLGHALTVEEVKSFTAKSLALIDEIRTRYLGAENNNSYVRQLAYGSQLRVAGDIRDTAASYKATQEIVESCLTELRERYVANPNLESTEKIRLLLNSVPAFMPLPRDFRLETSNKVYEMVLALDTPESRLAYVDRGALRASFKLWDEAIQDYNSAISDPKTSADIRLLARSQRMELLSNLQKWEQALEEAKVLSDVKATEATGDVFGPALVLRAKSGAYRVRAAVGDMQPEARVAASDALLLEAMSITSLSADAKTEILVDLLIDQSKEAAQLMKWEEALGLAKCAYNIAPNTRVTAVIRQVQLLLANRSRGHLTSSSFSVAPAPADVANAQAFYARQSGTKTAGDKTVVLAADLSNDSEFPRQLDSVAVPFSVEVKAGLVSIAAEHEDACTRAIAQGLLGKSDEAIAIMGAHIAELGLETSQLSAMVNFTARFVRAKLESVALANAFLQSQVQGPAGKDGQLGTEDDTPNPLSANAR